jgi:hypothetical protein
VLLTLLHYGQALSTSKHQGVTQCTLSVNEVSNWNMRLSILESMIAQVVAIVTKKSHKQQQILKCLKKLLGYNQLQSKYM